MTRSSWCSRAPAPSLRVGSIALLLLAACGDDSGGTATDATTVAPTSSATSTGTSEPLTTSTSTGDASGSGGSSTSTGASSSSGGSTGAATTGEPIDPNYPPPDDGGCSGGGVPIMVPGGSFCAPFCTGEGDTCPPPADAEATPVCEPFDMGGGSGAACTGDDECSDGEVCWQQACIQVAFWACKLNCGGNLSCPAGMSCVTNLCAYPD